MDYLFNDILSNTSENITVLSAVVTMLSSVLSGVIIALTYYKTQKENYQRSFAQTLIMLPIILAVIIVFIGSNIARAFSLAGTLSIIRFRSAPGDPKDIGYIFFDIAAGLACGVGLYGYGLLFVVLLCLILIVLEKLNLFERKDKEKHLKITIPEDLNYENAFNDILLKYTIRSSLEKIRTTDLGSLFEICYNVVIKKDVNEQEFLNELRCRNGNLSIILAQAPKIVK